jgi:hypothetical protein
MTDLLLSPEDTGEIPTGPAFDPDNPGTHAWDCDCEREQHDPGPDTRNLAPFTAGLGPFLRKGELTEPVPYEPHTIGVVDDLATPGTPGTPGPDPTPPFPPPPPPPMPAIDDRPRSAGEEIAWRQEWRPETEPRGWWGRLRYPARHRRSGR